MGARKAGALVAAVLLAAPARSARAAGPATDAYDGIREGVPLDVHGLADVYVQHAFGLSCRDLAHYRDFDAQCEALAIESMGFGFAHRPSPSAGFRLDLGVGETATSFFHSDPASADHPGLSRALSTIAQGFVTVVVPVGRGLAIDVGKFGTPVGFEDNEIRSNWNYSRSILFTLGEPTYHSGARIMYAPSDALAISLFWVNGWNTNFLGNGMRTVAAAVGWRATAMLEGSVVYMAGPERPSARPTRPEVAFRNEVAGYGVLRLTPRLSFAAAADYGVDAMGGGVTWWGVVGYLRYDPWPFLGAALRAEHYADPDGFTSGTRQHLVSATLTLEARANLGDVALLVRPEIRRDQSDVRAFGADGAGLARHGDTAAIGVILSF